MRSLFSVITVYVFLNFVATKGDILVVSASVGSWKASIAIRNTNARNVLSHPHSFKQLVYFSHSYLKDGVCINGKQRILDGSADGVCFALMSLKSLVLRLSYCFFLRSSGLFFSFFRKKKENNNTTNTPYLMDLFNGRAFFSTQNFVPGKPFVRSRLLGQLFGGTGSQYLAFKHEVGTIGDGQRFLHIVIGNEDAYVLVFNRATMPWMSSTAMGSMPAKAHPTG